MDQILQNVKRNLHYLAENTKNLSDLIDVLVLNKFIDDFDQQVISKGRSYEIAAELYIRLLSNEKINSDEAILLRCFKETGNGIFTSILTKNYITKEKSATPQRWFEIKPPSIYFVGRKDQLNNLEKWFLLDKSEKSVLISGSSGIGKSEVAKVFAKTFYLNYEGNCIWLKEENASVYFPFQRLVNNFGQDLEDYIHDEEKLQIFVWEIFSALSNRPCLLIIDDITNYEDQFLNLLVRQYQLWEDHYLLITSKVRPINNIFSKFREIKLQQLSTLDAKSYFSSTLKSLIPNFQLAANNDEKRLQIPLSSHESKGGPSTLFEKTNWSYINNIHEKFGEFIRDQLMYLSGNTLVDENFLDCLLEAKCLSAAGRDKILAEKVKYTRSTNFYMKVVKSGPSTLSHIIHALRQTEQNTLADDLEKKWLEFLDISSSSCCTTSSSIENPDARNLSLKQASDISSCEHSTSVSPTQPSLKKEILKFKRPSLSQSNPYEDLYASGILTKYQIESTPRGYALIINMIQFDIGTYSFRDEAKYDSEQLTRLLIDLDYEVYSMENLSVEEFFEVIDDFLEKFKETQLDSCIVSIMAHEGNGDLILTSDRELISVNQVLEKFSNVNCPQLNGKPKIFFMHHCRGIETDKGASTVTFDSIPKQAPPEQGRLTSVSAWTDMLVCYSTLERHYSFREKDKGTRFIQILCEVFRKYSKELDICKMLNLVAKEMMKKNTEPVQTPEGFAATSLKQTFSYCNIHFIRDFYFHTYN